jgi:hypothetical protein
LALLSYSLADELGEIGRPLVG